MLKNIFYIYPYKNIIRYFIKTKLNLQISNWFIKYNKIINNIFAISLEEKPIEYDPMALDMVIEMIGIVVDGADAIEYNSEENVPYPL